MGQITVVVPDELEKRLRKAVVDRNPTGRGKIKDALVEAIKLWLKK